MTDIKIFEQMVKFWGVREIKVIVTLHTGSLRPQKGTN